jgi:hypothetical protein
MTEYTDRCGKTIDRETALREAAHVIESQGDYHDIIREHVRSLSDPELMEWIVYPDTGEFSEYLHRETP